MAKWPIWGVFSLKLHKRYIHVIVKTQPWIVVVLRIYIF